MTKKLEDKNYNWGTKVGDRYSKLTVLAIAGKDNQKQRMWTVECDCGTVKDIAGYRLRRGSVGSCGCLAKTAGGQSTTRLYKIWAGMKSRCNNEENQSYHSYGGRGITMCKEWTESYEAFRNWALANGYEETLTIDRIDNDGNYEPDNCRWATMMVQGSNKRNNVLIEIDGVEKTLSNWARHAGIPINTIKQRRFKGKTGRELIEPVKPHTRKRPEKMKLYYLPGGDIMNVKEIEAKFGIKATTFYHRLNAGWKHEDLLNPVMKQKKRA